MHYKRRSPIQHFISLLFYRKTEIILEVDWTFPLNFAAIISGDGKQVYPEKMDITNTLSFDKKKFIFTPNLKNRKWVRGEVWDADANGAFTKPV